MDNLILSPIPLDQLLQSITTSVLEAIRSDNKSVLQESLLSTAEVSKLFKVSQVTVSNWVSKGLLTRYSIGGRNRFKYSEVMDSMKTLKKYKIN